MPQTSDEEYHGLILDRINLVLDRLAHVEHNEIPHLWSAVRRAERLFYALCGLLLGLGVLEVVGWIK